MTGFGIAATLMAVMAAGGAWAETGVVQELREAMTELSGRPLPDAASELLFGGGPAVSVALHPLTNQVLVSGASGRPQDWAPMMLDQDGEFVSVEYTSGRRIVVSPSALLRAIRSEPATGGPVAGAACLDRVAGSGGTVTAGLGPLRPGWRIESWKEGRRILSAEGRVGHWNAAGTALQLRVGPEEETVGCAEIGRVLSEPPPGAREAAPVLISLILVLEDGNTALDRLAEYQRGLAALARSSISDGIAARLPLAECRQLATLAIICDRLIATYRQP